MLLKRYFPAETQLFRYLYRQLRSIEIDYSRKDKFLFRNLLIELKYFLADVQHLMLIVVYSRKSIVIIQFCICMEKIFFCSKKLLEKNSNTSFPQKC